jgi:hypothetical protein
MSLLLPSASRARGPVPILIFEHPTDSSLCEFERNLVSLTTMMHAGGGAAQQVVDTALPLVALTEPPAWRGARWRPAGNAATTS